MSDYRNSNYDYRDPNDPFRSNTAFDPNARPVNATVAWIALAVFVVIVLAIIVGAGHKAGQLGTNTAFNDPMPPAASQMAPPLIAHIAPSAPSLTVLPPTTSPAAGTPTPPVAPAPNTPAAQH